MAGLDHTGKAGAGGEFAQQATTWMTPSVVSALGSAYTRDGGQAGKERLTVAGQAQNWTTPTALERSGQGERNKALVLDVKAWSTPRASDGKNGGPNQRGSKGDLMLPSMVAQWPTPDVCSAARDMSKVDPLKQKRADTKVTIGLPTVASSWPTPVTSDSRSQLGGGMPDRMSSRTASPSLSQVVTHSHSLPQAQQIPDGPPSSPSTPNSPRHLNPLFGAWLMGWPSTWVIAEPHASSALGTESYHSKLQQHLSCLFDEQEGRSHD